MSITSLPYAKLTNIKKMKKNSRGKFKAEKFATFDIETRDGLLGKEIFCWALATSIPRSSKKKKVIPEEPTSSLDELFRFFQSRFENVKNPKRDLKYLVIFVHNLGFDIRFIVDYCLRHNIEYQPILSGSKMIAFIIDSLKVRFVDSVQFLFSSQENAEIDWEIESEYRKIDCNEIFKKPFPKWNDEEKERVWQHNRNDVMALHAIMINFRKVFLELHGVDCLSIFSMGSLAMKCFRTSIPVEEPIVNPYILCSKKKKSSSTAFGYVCDKEKYNFVKNSYFGGRNEVIDFNRHYDEDYVDKVSMYPSELKEKFPDGIPEWYNETSEIENLIELGKYEKIKDFKPKSKEIKEYLEKGLFGVIECEFHAPSNEKFPVLPSRLIDSNLPINEGKYCGYGEKLGKVCFSNDKQTGIFTSLEIKYAFYRGYEIKCIRALIFPFKRKFFSSYIDKMFEVKRTSKGGKKKAGKISMNSLYGKFGQDILLDEPIFIFENSIEDLIDKVHALGTEEEIQPYFSDELQKFFFITSIEREVMKPYMIIHIASFTTARGRLSLLQQIHECNDNMNIPVHYGDTDSISIPHKFTKLLSISGELGGWDVEEHYDIVQYLAPKAYLCIKFRKTIEESGKTVESYLNKGWEFLKYSDNVLGYIKLKGVEKRKLREIVKNSESMDEMEYLVRDDIELAERYDTFRSSLRHGVALRTRKLSKHYSYEYSKRVVKKDKTTRPIGYIDENILHLAIISLF